MTKTKAELARTYALQSRYGLSDMKYAQMLREQNERCAICGRTEENRNLAIDHDHTTGEIRGLLCGQCNRGLGLFGDSINLLECALHYLLGED